MAKRSTLLQSRSRLIGDRQGNFGLMAAILLPLLLASGGVALDMSNMMMANNQLQDATDTAALAASSALVNEGLTQAEAKLLATRFVKTQMQAYSSSAMTAAEKAAWETELSGNTAVDIVEDKAALGNAKTYKVEVSSKFDLRLSALTGLLGHETAAISATSTSFSSTEARNALSMYLVLDQSGSMGETTNTVNPDQPTKKCGQKSCPNYLTKIAALKLATANLLTQLKIADPTSALVRAGVASYSTRLVDQRKLDWGVTTVMEYVNSLPAEGSTDSSGAIAVAYKSLASADEESAHANKNGQVPKKFIVFMTDGENNYFNNKPNDTQSDSETRKTCDRAKKDGMEVYAVAFMAPTRGQTLLKSCATSAAHYFPAENASELTAAFKYIGEKASEMSVRLTQ